MLNKDLAVELCKAILTSKSLPLGQISITVLTFPYLLTWCQVQSPFCFSFEQLDLKVFSNFISIYWVRLGENTFFRVKSKWNLNHPKKLIFNVDISPKDSDPQEWMRDEDRSCLCIKQSSYVTSCTVFDVATFKVILKTRSELVHMPSVRCPLLGRCS